MNPKTELSYIYQLTCVEIKNIFMYKVYEEKKLSTSCSTSVWPLDGANAQPFCKNMLLVMVHFRNWVLIVKTDLN